MNRTVVLPHINKAKNPLLGITFGLASEKLSSTFYKISLKMQPPLQVFYTNSWKQLLCCSVLLGQCQSRAHQVVASAPWAEFGGSQSLSTHVRAAGNSRDEAIAKHRWDVYFWLCSLWGTEMAALNISTYKAEQEKPWLAVMMQKVHKDAGTGPVLGSAP